MSTCETTRTLMSMFNTDIILSDCKNSEEGHPQYTEAVAVELAAVQRGGCNFPGIGRPADL